MQCAYADYKQFNESDTDYKYITAYESQKKSLTETTIDKDSAIYSRTSTSNNTSNTNNNSEKSNELSVLAVFDTHANALIQSLFGSSSLVESSRLKVTSSDASDAVTAVFGSGGSLVTSDRLNVSSNDTDASTAIHAVFGSSSLVTTDNRLQVTSDSKDASGAISAVFGSTSLVNSGVLKVADAAIATSLSTVFGATALNDAGSLLVKDSGTSGAISTVFGSSLLARTDNKLSVYDDTLITNIGTIFGTGAFPGTGTDTQSKLRVADSEAKSVLDSIHTATQSNSTVSLSTDTLNTLKKALNGTTADTESLAKVIREIKTLLDPTNSNKAHVRIQNEDGQRLQVDTEQMAFDETAYDMSEKNENGKDISYGAKTTSNIVW